MIQHHIDKYFEIRTFFYNNRFYSTAILSQQNEKTKIDFRKYDLKNPNRNLFFKLPTEYETKIKKLMRYFSIDTGSFDTIVERNTNRLIFLEVNPVGQFGGLSFNTNTYIEKDIAEYIKTEYEKK